MKLNGIIILRINDFNRYFDFAEFWEQRLAFLEMFKGDGYSKSSKVLQKIQQFCDDNDQVYYLNLLLTWLKGERIKGYKIEGDAISSLLKKWNVKNMDKQKDLLKVKLSDSDFIGIAALFALLHKETAAAIDVHCILSCLGKESESDDGSFISLLPNNVKELESYAPGTCTGTLPPLRSVVMACLASKGQSATVRFLGKDYPVAHGQCVRALFIGDKCLKIQEGEVTMGDYHYSLQLQPDHSTNLHVVHNSIVQTFCHVDVCAMNSRGYVYHTVDSKEAVTHHHERIDTYDLNMEMITDGKVPIWMDIRQDNQSVLALTADHTLYVLDTSSPFIKREEDIVFAAFEKDGNIEIKK